MDLDLCARKASGKKNIYIYSGKNKTPTIQACLKKNQEK
jgi:hypothetical protein